VYYVGGTEKLVLLAFAHVKSIKFRVAFNIYNFTRHHEVFQTGLSKSQSPIRCLYCCSHEINRMLYLSPSGHYKINMAKEVSLVSSPLTEKDEKKFIEWLCSYDQF